MVLNYSGIHCQLSSACPLFLLPELLNKWKGKTVFCVYKQSYKERVSAKTVLRGCA